MNKIQTYDLYEGSFYLCKSCTIETVEAIVIDGKVNCRFTLMGRDIFALQATYFSGAASINLFDFRRTYSQLQKLVHDSRKKYKNKPKSVQLTGGQI